MPFFKFVVSCAAMTIGARVQASVQRPVPGTTRLEITCNLIKKNVEEGTTENTLHPRSIYFKIINRMNFFINKLSTPPPAEYLFVTVGSGVLSVENSGTDVVLSRFPDAGKDLTTFGLTPPKIKTIALPNDLQEWPASALSGCTALERITTFGEEVDEIKVALESTHFQDCSKLAAIQMPSSIELRSCVRSIESVTCSKNQKTIYNGFCRGCSHLHAFDFGKMSKLETIEGNTFLECGLTKVDLSKCLRLKLIRWHAFTLIDSVSVVFSPSDFVSETMSPGGDSHCAPFNYTPIRTIIWKGRSTRPSGLAPCTFHYSKTLDTLISEGTITEIFVP